MYYILVKNRNDDMRMVQSRAESEIRAGGDFPAGAPLSAICDKTLSARPLLSTQHIYTQATAEEKGHEGQ